MVVTNESGQLLAYELADGANTWTLPLSSPEAQVRGTLEAGTAVVLDEVERERPLAPRSTRRLRIIDASSGEVRLEARVAGEVGAVHAVGGGRDLVTAGGQTLLLAPTITTAENTSQCTPIRTYSTIEIVTSASTSYPAPFWSMKKRNRVARETRNEASTAAPTTIAPVRVRPADSTTTTIARTGSATQTMSTTTSPSRSRSTPMPADAMASSPETADWTIPTMKAETMMLDSR